MKLVMRPYNEGDVEAYTAGVRQSLDTLQPWMTWAHENFGEQDARDWIRFTHLQRQAGAANELGVFSDDGTFLGGAGLRFNSDPAILPSIGYWVRSSAQRQGIATEIVRRLAHEAFNERNIALVEILAAENNFASRAVAVKAGAEEVAVKYGLIVLNEGPVSTVVYHLRRPQ